MQIRNTFFRILTVVFLMAQTLIFLSDNPAQISAAPSDDGPLTGPAETERMQLAQEAYAKLPLYFIENQGQQNERVAYYAQQGGANIYFTAEEMVMALPETVLRARFVDANPNVHLTGDHEKEAKFNYLIGGDPAQWRQNIRSYDEVTYHDLYPGVDLTYSGRNGVLKYQFLLQPGADVEVIRLTYNGVEELSLAENGDLLIRLESQYVAEAHEEITVRDTAPSVYQEVNGARVEVEAAFTIYEGQTYGFVVGEYDSRYPLIIDPELYYATLLGGSDIDNGFAIALDGAGNVYVAGKTKSAGFPTSVGAYDESYNGGGEFGDVFVSVFDPTLSNLRYSTFLGGSGDEGNRTAIFVDDSGNVYVTGFTESTNYPTTAGAYDTTHNGGQRDAFVSVLDPTLSNLRYSTFLGGSGLDYILAITVNDSGDIYVTGHTYRGDFPTTAGAYDTSFNGNYDVFVSIFDPTLRELRYSTLLGGSSGDGRWWSAITLDDAGNVYITAFTESSNFPTTAGAYDRSFNGNGDIFVSVFDPTLSNLRYSTLLGGSSTVPRGGDEGRSIVLDGAGNIYISGVTYSNDFPTTTGAYDESHNGGSDAYVSIFDPTLSNLRYSTFLGGSNNDQSKGIVLGSAGNIYVVGSTGSDGFPTTTGAYDESYNGSGDVFVSVFDPTLSSLSYSSFLGGSTDEYGMAIALDNSSNIYLTGVTSSSDFPTTPSAFDTSYDQNGDVFVVKISTKAGNTEPIITTEQSEVLVNENQMAINSGTVNDPDNDSLTLSASVGTLINNDDDTWSWSFATSDGPADSQTVTISADDGNGGLGQTSFELIVNNVAPSVDTVFVPLDPIAISDQPVNASATFSDPGSSYDEPFTCTVDYGDDKGSQSGLVSGFDCNGPDHTYDNPGIYEVSVTVTDKDGDSGNATATTFVVVYDPEGGFVTGGGWIDSPPEAYTPDPTLTGKATFGFVSKYKKGADIPTGQTEFQFKVADLNFHSESYDWLVVAGHKAQFKGTGTINGGGNYGFMLTAVDEALTPSTDVDLFRIKIWDKDDADEIVYDNQMTDGDEADPTTEIGGGSIVIHKAK